MVINMNEERLGTIEQIEQFLSAGAPIEFSASGGDNERYGHFSRVLKRFDYPRRGKRERGILLRYLASPYNPHSHRPSAGSVQQGLSADMTSHSPQLRPRRRINAIRYCAILYARNHEFASRTTATTVSVAHVRRCA
jgi:hypothetical protein